MEISMNHLNIKDFNTKKEILSNINLKIKDGASLGIVGPSGSGKTTLSNILLGIKNKEMIFEGSVQYMLDEKNIINISEYNLEISPKIKKRIGYIPQDTMNIFDPVEKLYIQFKETLSENG
ncbi:Flp pilus assembly complex ATPase component TadA, partial [Enterococcus faecium]|nr:Flp pilus assembly complex ATPase component TadA [Enterococcus faecium]